MKGSRGTGEGEEDEDSSSDPGGDVLDMSRPPSPITPTAGATTSSSTASCFYHNTLSTTFHKSRDETREVQDSPCYNFRIGEVTTASFRTPDPEVLQEDLRELELTRRHLVERNAELNAQIHVCEDANNSLRKHCLDLEAGLKSFQHQVKDKEKLEDDIKELQCLLDNEREARQSAEAQVYVLKKEKFSLASKIEDAEIELKCCQEENYRSKQRVCDVVKEKESDAASFRQMIEQYKTRLSEEAKIAENLREENEELHADLQNLQEELVYCQEKLSVVPAEVNRTVEEDDLQLNTSSRSRKTSWTPELFTTCSKTPPATETPGSIRSEIEMMSTSDGCIPFCGKSERGMSTGSLHSEKILLSSGKGDASSLSFLTSILNWWRQSNNQNDSSSKGFKDEKESAMYSHFLKHYDELLKLEKGLQNIVKKEVDHSSPLPGLASGKTPPPSRRTSVDSTAGTVSPEANLEGPNAHTPSSGFRTPGSLVSNLIYKFERSSLSPSPSYSSESKRSTSAKECELEGEEGNLKSKRSKPNHDYNYLRDSKIINRIFVESGDDRLDSNSNLISTEEDSDNVTDVISEDASECLTGSLPQSCNASDVLDSGFEQDPGYGIVTLGYQPMYGSKNDILDKKNEETRSSEEQTMDKRVVLSGGLDYEESEISKDTLEVTATLELPQVSRVSTPRSARDAEPDELDVDVEAEAFMKQSRLMRLTNQVREKDRLLKKVKQQLSEAQDEVEANYVLMIRIFRLASHVSGDAFRWIETVRKEWLSSVPVVREDEGASAPLRTPDPLYDMPLTGSHSREEIESLINTRCDLGCQVSRDDLGKEYVNPESLAIELERELLALKLHVARSHALLHHYQSSSLHGSHSEVSTPPVAVSTHHVQGVEAGVEADLCGPTCIPRPCDSTATQTPASPISVSPECEEARSAAEEESVNLSNDGGGDDPLQDDHRPLTPQHRPLYQRMSLSEEEVEEDSACDTEMAVSSDHVIYAPKPTYDQLDQYSVKPKKADEKCRRTGNIHAQIGGSLGRRGGPDVGGGGGGGGGNSDSEEEKGKEKESPFCVLLARPPRLPFTRQIRCHSDPQVAPLSPPPSLDMEDDDEEMTKDHRPQEEEEEEDLELPSTPESGPSSASASGDVFTATPAYATFSSGSSSKRRLHLPKVDPTESESTPSTPAAVKSKEPGEEEEEEEEEDFPEKTAPSWDSVFPSLQDSHLKGLGLSVHDASPLNENLSAQEIENKFKQLSLAIKTDRLTLKQRLDVQHRQRDTAEANFERELDQLKKSILALHEDCLDTDLVDAIMQVRKHVDVLTTSSSSLLSASEVWGAVQQEWRVSKALEVLLLHVENVKRLYEHDHQELEEMRRVLQENQIEYPATSGSGTSHLSSAGDLEGANRRGRAFSVAALSKQTSENGSRRISLGPGASKSVLNQFLSQRSSRRRLSLVTDLRPFHQELANTVEKAVAAKAQENNEEKPSNNMMSRSSITEEGRESEDEDTDSAGQDNNSPSAATLRTLTHFPLYGQSRDDPSDMTYEDDNTSLLHSQVTDTHTANNTSGAFGLQSQNWLHQCLEELLRNYRTGNWPYTNQQIIRGVFTSFLLIVAVFCLIIAATSADEGLLEPRCPDWTIYIKYNGLPPT